MRSTNESERALAKEILGDKGESLAKNVNINFSNLLIDGRATSLPVIGILMSDKAENKTTSNINNSATFIHELFHQIQYAENNLRVKTRGTYVELGNDNFSKLIVEQIAYSMGKKVYDYGDLSKVNKLSDIKTLEGQAAMVGEFTKCYLMVQNGETLGKKDQAIMNDAARILNNSGYESKAITDTLKKDNTQKVDKEVNK